MKKRGKSAVRLLLLVLTVVLGASGCSLSAGSTATGSSSFSSAASTISTDSSTPTSPSSEAVTVSTAALSSRSTLHPQPTHLRPGTSLGVPANTTTTPPPPSPATPVPEPGTPTSFVLSPITGDILPTTWHVYPQNHPLITWKGAWTDIPDSNAWGGDYRQSVPPTPSSMTVIFRGTEIRLLQRLGPDQGMAKVVLDKAYVYVVDLYAPQPAFQLAFNSGTLPLNFHTLRFEWTGAKNNSATGTAVNVDSLEVKGDLVVDDDF